MTWFYKNAEIDESILNEYVGFVYEITNLVDGRKYIGKKLLKKTKTKQVNGKKKKIKVDSDWKTYYGSNRKLNEDVLAMGPDKFYRNIILLCKNKGMCNYHEAKLQFLHEVLENDNYYNDWIMVKVSRSHVKK